MTLMLIPWMGMVMMTQAPTLHTPADVVAAALENARRNPDATHFRYFDLGISKPDPGHAELLSVLQFGVNSLSRRKLLARLTPVSGVGERLLRIDLRSCGITSGSWEQLGEQGSGPQQSTQGTACPEPYFHQEIVTVTQEVRDELVDCAPYQEGGQWYRQRWKKTATGEVKTKRVSSHASWLAAGQIAELAQRTQSEFPIVRADWFVASALLPPAYHRFLDVKTLADFQHLTRFRERDDDLAVRGNLLFSSEVALHNRALLRTPTVLGYYWRSLDYLSSLGQSDVLANVLNTRADASEIIATLPNGLQAYALINGKSGLIDFADPNIAIDRSTKWDNKLVWTGLSCMVCHAKGLKDFTDDVRQLADLKKHVYALVKPENAERFMDLFGPDHRQFVTADQGRYAAAVQACTGVAPEENAKRLSKVFISYVQEPVTLATASRETGYPADKITAVLAKAKNLPHGLVQLLAGMPLRRDQWERDFGTLMSLLTATNQN